MKLSAKLLLLFGLGLAAMLGFAAWGFPRVVSSISETQLMGVARTVGGYLVHDLETLPWTGDEPSFQRAIDLRFEFVQKLGAETGNFRVNTILLVDQKLQVEVAHPGSEIGADYSSHVDIREAFGTTGLKIVLESPVAPAGGTIAQAPGSPSVAAAALAGKVEADIVSPVLLTDGDSRVLEIKLDFSGTLGLLEAQYSQLRLIAAVFIAVALGLLVLALLFVVRVAILRPLLGISAAMERVGRGDLEARAATRGKDEIAAMGERFNAMVGGLKERFELERYVSKSTVGAAKARAESGLGHSHTVVRKTLTVFFSDVRGFTTYSERTDPARVIAVLNLILGLQEEIITACQGEVDKFVGDEAMAVFPRPVDAVAAGLAIREKIARISGDIDGLSLGIGIHSGELVEGDIGSPRMMNHTVIGDTVNVAARLQAAATPGQVIVSEAVAVDRAVAATFSLKGLGGIRVKGKELPIEVWEVAGRLP